MKGVTATALATGFIHHNYAGLFETVFDSHPMYTPLGLIAIELPWRFSRAAKNQASMTVRHFVLV